MNKVSREVIIKGRRKLVLKSIPRTFRALTFNEEPLTLFQRQVQILRDDPPSYGLDDSESTDLPANRLENRVRADRPEDTVRFCISFEESEIGIHSEQSVADRKTQASLKQT
ncbi:hypothetical protein K0M31_011254 [Melipona bicolor]|uniref:Uncharacterized protein n=1 Tax=Melipona bicolor TaxID=60889 RepID=A0AA40KUK5_9HYME|nr:hypothetical protein K0M31_011254 [Melipona bicolor]